MPGNPLEDIDTLNQVRFVMKDGMVFKRDGVMTPGAFFNGGPVNGWVGDPFRVVRRDESAAQQEEAETSWGGDPARAFDNSR